MKSQRIKMSVEEYLQMQQPFGYKVEYYNGEAHFQPRELFIDGRLTLQPQKVAPHRSYQPVKAINKQPLKEAFFSGFHHVIEFCDWPEHAIRKQAENNIDEYFAGGRGEPNAASKLWCDQDGKIAALALFLTTKEGKTKLDLLCVLPEFQRQGIATEMISLAINELLQQGVTEIYSSWHALNQASQSWHHQLGFTDVYNQYYIRLKHSWYKHEIHRLEEQGMSDDLKKLRQQKNYWYHLLDEKWQKLITH